jgi:very-short-patch-repair endonuclease
MGVGGRGWPYYIPIFNLQAFSMNQREQNLFQGAPPEIFRRAKELRKNMTQAEQKLWTYLKAKETFPAKFRRQHPIKRYILDFYCHKARLGIEVDGVYHQEKGQQFYDQDRTSNLNEFGVEIIRFTNDEIMTEIDRVVKEISLKIEERMEMLE